MSKTILIARRELMENMRTKTFWAGILIAPIGIVLMYAVSYFLAASNASREFVVLDETKDAWFGQAVARKAEQQEVDRFLDSLPAANPARRLFRLYEKISGKKLETWTSTDLVQNAAELKQHPEIIALTKDLAADPKLQRQLETTSREILERKQRQALHEAFRQVEFQPQGEDSEKILDQMLTDDKLFAYFVIRDAENGGSSSTGGTRSKYVSKNVTDFKLRTWFGNLATEVLRERNIAELKKTKGLDEQDVAAIRARFEFEQKAVTTSGKQKDVSGADMASKYAPLVFVYVLWLSVFMAAQMLLTNTVEEKSNRIIEVLLSSVSPGQLMHGKIFGIAATGLVIVGSWALFAYAGIKLAPHVMPSAATKITELGLDGILGNPIYLGSFLAYFLTGYLIFASILVALGSVCNSLKEAQNLQQPVVFLLIVPMLTMLPIVWDPNGKIAKIMTYIPIYTPFAMMNRAGGPPATWEYVVSSAIILVTLLVGFVGAGKVFRVGVLMTGKPPRLREILGWLRAPTR